MKFRKLLYKLLCGAICIGFVACENEEPKGTKDGNEGEKNTYPINPENPDSSNTANPTIETYTITVSANSDTMGIVTGGGLYEENSNATIEAVPNYGYKFSRWDDNNLDNPRTVTVIGEQSFKAFFEPLDYVVTVAVNDESMGTVSGEGTYKYLQTVTLTATANSDYYFLEWADGDRNNPRTITVTKDILFTANFRNLSGTENGYSFADLGLPSGTLWATMNVGATAPEEQGYFFTWGDVEPKQNSESNENDYKWGVYYNSYPDFGMKKYTITDGKEVLEAEDDAATQIWGGDWRMPTWKEMEELLDEDNCTWTWTWINDMYGYEVKGTNGNSIFLPAPLCCLASAEGSSVHGSYWTSSRSEMNCTSALQLMFSMYTKFCTASGARYYHQLIRAVCSPK